MRTAVASLSAVLICACGSPPSAPAVPSNFAATFWPDNVLLSWDPVKGATYEVYILLPPVVWKTLPTSGSQLHFFYGNGFVGSTSVAFAVRSVSPAGPSALTGEIRKPASEAQATITAAGTTATVAWPPSYGAASIALGTTPDALTEIVQATGGSWQRTGLEPGRTYFWKVIFASPPISFQTFGTTHVAPLPPAAQVAYAGEQFMVSWPAVDGASRYRLRATSGGSITTTDLRATSFGPTACDGTPVCTFELATVTDTDCVSAYSSPLQVINPPAIPPAPAVQSGVDKVVVSLPSLPLFADHLRILRGDNALLPLSQIGITAAGSTTFTDATALPWQRHIYAVQAITSGGVESLASPPSAPVFATGSPVTKALGGDGTETDTAEGESFQVSSGGRLAGIEVALSGPPGWVRLELSAGGRPFLRNDALAQPASALVPDVITGTYFDFSPAGVPVSAGEVLHFDIVGSGALTAGLGAATSGGHLRHGSPDVAHDLACKLFFISDATLNAPPALKQTAGIQAIRVDWGAVAGAVRYDIYRDDGAVNGLVGSTSQRWYLDQGVLPGRPYSYGVHAVAADGTEAANTNAGSSSLTANWNQIATECLGTTGGASVPLCTAGAMQPGGVVQLDQDFSVSQSGTLVALEARVEGLLSIGPADPIDLPVSVGFEILDASGVSLGHQTVQALPSVPSPLVPFVMEAGADVSSLGIAVTAGQLLTLRLTNALGAGRPCIPIRDSADSCTGGHEVRDGVMQAGRNLAVRATVR